MHKADNKAVAVSFNYTQMCAVNIDIIIVGTPCFAVFNCQIALATRKLKEIGGACNCSALCGSKVAVSEADILAKLRNHTQSVHEFYS
jgi:hypothetical protein